MSDITSRPATREYRDNYDRIFRSTASPVRPNEGAEGDPGNMANSRPGGRGSVHPHFAQPVEEDPATK